MKLYVPIIITVIIHHAHAVASLVRTYCAGVVIVKQHLHGGE